MDQTEKCLPPPYSAAVSGNPRSPDLQETETKLEGNKPITMELLHIDILALTRTMDKFMASTDRNIAAQKSKIEIIENSIKDAHNQINSSITAAIAKEMAQFTTELHNATTATAANTKAIAEITELKRLVAQQTDLIKKQGDSIIDLHAKLEKGDLTARKEARAALDMANSIESHQRRWAVRIMGIPVPTEHETIPDAKNKAAEIINDVLKLEDIDADEMDCAHRVGRVTDGKQALLVRFFSRDIVDRILNAKSLTKDTVYSVFEDATFINRRLQYALQHHPNFHSAWISNGTVWAKKTLRGDKFKVSIHANIDLL